MMIPGITVAMGGQEFVVPPLALDQLQKFLPRVKEVAGLPANGLGEEQIAILIEVITAALKRNYPELTTAAVANLLDLGNAGTVLMAVLAASDQARLTVPNLFGANPAP